MKLVVSASRLTRASQLGSEIAKWMHHHVGEGNYDLAAPREKQRFIPHFNYPARDTGQWLFIPFSEIRGRIS